MTTISDTLQAAYEDALAKTKALYDNNLADFTDPNVLTVFNFGVSIGLQNRAALFVKNVREMTDALVALDKAKADEDGNIEKEMAAQQDPGLGDIKP
jgi:hypothetical protein